MIRIHLRRDRSWPQVEGRRLHHRSGVFFFGFSKFILTSLREPPPSQPPQQQKWEKNSGFNDFCTLAVPRGCEGTTMTITTTTALEAARFDGHLRLSNGRLTGFMRDWNFPGTHEARTQPKRLSSSTCGWTTPDGGGGGGCLRITLCVYENIKMYIYMCMYVKLTRRIVPPTANRQCSASSCRSWRES